MNYTICFMLRSVDLQIFAFLHALDPVFSLFQDVGFFRIFLVVQLDTDLLITMQFELHENT